MLCLRSNLTMIKKYKKLSINDKLNNQYLVIFKVYINNNKLPKKRKKNLLALLTIE